MNGRRKLSVVALLAFIMVAALVGCSADSSNESNTNEEAAENTDASNDVSNEANAEDGVTDEPIVIEHAFGETVIESKPERIVTIQWANHDVALALGVVPVGFSAANYGVQDDSGLLPWTAEKLNELGVEDPNVFQDTDGLDFEAINDANPDVILAGYSGITQEDYDLLTQIAPVVPYKTAPWETTWREQVMLNAKGMGMAAEGEQLIKETEQLVASRASEYPEMQGKKVVWVNFSATDMSQFHVYTENDPRGAFLIELGMEYPESISNLTTEDTGFALKLSTENSDALYDADLIIGYGDNSLYEAVKADPVLGKIPAIERGSVVFIGNGTPLAAAGNPNPLSIAYTIDEYLELIGEAIAKIDE